jgi:hypothetical protein
MMPWYHVFENIKKDQGGWKIEDFQKDTGSNNGNDINVFTGSMWI